MARETGGHAPQSSWAYISRRARAVSFLIDADVVSAHLRGRAHVTSRLLQYTGRLFMSTVTLAELQTWLHRQATPQRYRDALALLKTEFEIVSIDEAVANRFGEVGAQLLD